MMTEDGLSRIIYSQVKMSWVLSLKAVFKALTSLKMKATKERWNKTTGVGPECGVE